MNQFLQINKIKKLNTFVMALTNDQLIFQVVAIFF